MKKTFTTRVFALVLCIALLAAVFPMSAFAETAESLSIVEGDVIRDFLPEGCACTTSDPTVAWVDQDGTLNALKPGVTTVTVISEDESSVDYIVTVEDYTDASPVVGNLKILARYNDSMQFYDGHVYLLFTSYQDNVQINVKDLYGGYEISDMYYSDIAEDIAYGSNHTGTDAEKYFTFNDEMTSVTLNRGEIVTIGMYRGFDLSIYQAALGCLQNSSFWNDLQAESKAAVVENIFSFLHYGHFSEEDAIANIKAVFDELGVDYTKALDGVVEGGVCFNRELYNQKLEWDQYENVTYEMDITGNQLNTMAMYLGGNLNNFSMMKNSCATVALRAWNAAVGTRNGEPGAYYLSAEGSGIYSIFDAPKGVRDCIVNRLPGYYHNTSENVDEPDAGFVDETGAVYVSAPEKVAPCVYNYNDTSLMIDDSKTKVVSVMNQSEEGVFTYGAEQPQIGVSVRTSAAEDATVIEGVDFTYGRCYRPVTKVKDGVWFKAAVTDPVEGTDYYAVGADGKAIPSYYDAEEGYVSFFAEALPFTFKLVGSDEGAQNILKTVVVNGDKASHEVEVYTKDGGDKVALSDFAEVKSDSKVFVKAKTLGDEKDYILTDIEVNSMPIMDEDNYDADEEAYFFNMPSGYSKLTVTFEKAVVEAENSENNVIQTFVGEKLDARDYATQYIGENQVQSDDVVWYVLSNEDNAIEVNGSELSAVGEGEAVLWACSGSNSNIGVFYIVQVFSSRDDMAVVTYSGNKPFYLSKEDEETMEPVPFSGAYIKKGTALTLVPDNTDDYALLRVTVNGNAVEPNTEIVVNEDTDVRVTFAQAEITGMPQMVALADADDSYQLAATARYTGLLRLLPVYDNSIRFVSTDPLVKVDETGLITVDGEIPAGGKAAYVYAYAGSSNDKVYSSTRVIVGDYDGDRIVGRMTISARKIYEGELVAHGALTYTTYDDLEIPISYYHYFQPNEKYVSLMEDYRDHPENYTSDPALYNENELGLTDRESYFNTLTYGAMSEAHPVYLKAGESFSVSNYGYDSTNLTTLYMALQGGYISGSEDAQTLVEQMIAYTKGEGFDSNVAFDSLLSTFTEMFKYTTATGEVAADGHSDGGIAVDREMYNQFRRNDSQMPNNYYTVEITADELAKMQEYLANPANNYYSLFSKNCATGVVNIWNTTLFDKPELHLSANLSVIASDPESLYIELGTLRLKPGLEGEGGVDFYPRTVADSFIREKQAFNAYKEEVKEKMDDLSDTYSDDEALKLIEDAKAAVDALKYDTEKSLDENKAAVDEIYDELEKALEEKALADAFDDYKSGAIALLDVLALADSGEEFQKMIADAKTAIDALEYDQEKSFEENTAAITEIYDAIAAVLEQQSKVEAFNLYKKGVDVMMNVLAMADSDEEYQQLIADAKAELAALQYDPEKTPEENRAAVNEIFTNLTAAIDELRQKEDFIPGDVDGDGELTIFDATAIQRYLADMPSQSFNEKAADYDGDGEITIFDVTAIQRTLAGLD